MSYPSLDPHGIASLWSVTAPADTELGTRLQWPSHRVAALVERGSAVTGRSGEAIVPSRHHATVPVAGRRSQSVAIAVAVAVTVGCVAVAGRRPVAIAVAVAIASDSTTQTTTQADFLFFHASQQARTTALLDDLRHRVVGTLPCEQLWQVNFNPDRGTIPAR